LERRGDIKLLTIDPALRKDPIERARLMNAADAVFLCLPDDAAREAAALVTNPNVVILDASTAHRTNAGWTYGFPELSNDRRAAIAAAKRIAVPGCHATGFIALVAPLIAEGWLPPDALISCHSLTGYSGGGSKMIAEYEASDRSSSLDAPRPYGLSQMHKHLPEMTKIAGLSSPPIFNPIVCDFFAGMIVSVPLHAADFARSITIGALGEFFRSYYQGARFVRVEPAPSDGFISANSLAGSNDLVIYVTGCDERVTIASTFDNLGKGASGAAMQCMNIALGFDEDAGF
jgi:N-acetyl-gamma-glutamyl-phosphate reductase